MKALHTSLLLTALTLGCGSSASGVSDMDDHDAQAMADKAPSPDADPTVDADAPTKDAPADAASDAVTEDASAVAPVLTVRFRAAAERAYARGTQGAGFFWVTLAAHRDVELFRLPVSFDQVRESACAIGGEGAPNYRRILLRNETIGATALTAPGELMGSPNSPRGTIELGGAIPLRLTAGAEYLFGITADIRLTDPRCPFLNQGVRVTVGDPSTGRFFPPEAVGLSDEGRYARPEEIAGNDLHTDGIVTVTGPDYGHPLVTDPGGLRGQFWFCDDPLNGLPGGDANGYRGCCSNGRWRTLEPGTQPQVGMLVRGVERSNLYHLFARRDGSLARAFFPSTGELNSWRHPSGTNHTGIDATDPTVCLDVVQMADAELALLPHGGNVTYRPGSTYVRLATDPSVWAVGADRELHPITMRDGMGLNDWLPARLLRTVPDGFSSSYRLNMRPTTFDRGTTADNALATFDAPAEQIETSLR